MIEVLWKCGAEQTGGRTGNGVAGAATVGMRCGTVPIALGWISGSLRSSVGRLPLYSCRRRSLGREGLSAVWVGRGRRRGAAECSGGCGSHGVAGARTVGIRSGTCPVPLWLSICVAAKQRGVDSALFWGKRRKWGAGRRAAYFIRLTQKGDGPICT